MNARICIDEYTLSCIIGCLPPERVTPQAVRVDLELSLDVGRAAETDRLESTWNYAHICRDVGFVLEQGRFYLLESAARTLLRYLLLPPAPDEARPAVQRARVSLTKFGVLPGGARPRIEVAGAAADQAWGVEDKPWGSVDVVAETERMGLYRLNIAPGQVLPHHVHRRMREAELVLTEGLTGWRDSEPDRPLPVGEQVLWRLGQPHGYRNDSARSGSLLCLDAPPFDPDDEIEVPR